MKLRALLSVLMVGAGVGTATAAELTRGDPASVGVDAAALAALKTRMNALVTDGNRAGLVYAVARKGTVVAMEALGRRNIESNLPMEPDTAFRIYSMTRAVSGAAALALVEEKKLALDDQVSKYIPEIAQMKVIARADGAAVVTEDQRVPMSVRHLFTYTSGLGYAPNWPKSLNFQQREVLDPEVPLAEGIANLTKYPLLYQPGTKWHYGFSGDVLGRVAEVAAGQPLDAVIKTRVLDKVGMRSTGFWITPEDNARHRLAEIYGKRAAGDPLVNMTASATPLSHFTRPGKLFSGGGGLVSTVPDYLRFAQMLLNGGTIDGVRVLDPTPYASCCRNKPRPIRGLFIGMHPDSSRV
jgi:CubicO group peptidase (beta-lactamase class C family)